jgi:hypothetical protein
MKPKQPEQPTGTPADPAIIAKIDAMDYEQLLHANRFGPIGHPMFLGENGDHFRKKFTEARNKLKPDELVMYSKRVGWDA